MGWLASLRQNRVAGRYAQKLPEALRKGWGGARQYTPAQIRTAAAKVGLDLNFIVFGYAAFLNEGEFAALVREMPVRLGYETARAAFRRHLPPASLASDADWPAPPLRYD